MKPECSSAVRGASGRDVRKTMSHSWDDFTLTPRKTSPYNTQAGSTLQVCRSTALVVADTKKRL